MKKIITSAPGKLMLMGEHSVVHDRGCLVVAVDQRLRVELSLLDQENKLIICAPNVNIKDFYYDLATNKDISTLPKEVRFVVQSVRNFKKKYADIFKKSGLQINTSSDFASTFGFGSSSAVTVGTIFALIKLFDVSVSNRQLFNLCYQTVLDVQGLGSGFDLAAAIWGGILYFETGGKKIEEISLSNLPLVVGYTGIKADTVTLVQQVNSRLSHYPSLMNTVFDLSWILVKKGKQLLQSQNWSKFGELMDLHQGLSYTMGVSSCQLEKQIMAARQAGALGAKLSGAGGGDCMLALVSDENRAQVEQSIKDVGGEVLVVDLLAPGVRVESK